MFERPRIDLISAPVSLFSYIGDAVMTLYYRSEFSSLMRPSKVEVEVRKRVSREGQAKLLDEIWESLSDEERGVVKRAMNSKSATRHGNDPLYRKSTGLEALVGYLYLKGEDERLEWILEMGKMI